MGISMNIEIKMENESKIVTSQNENLLVFGQLVQVSYNFLKIKARHYR